MPARRFRLSSIAREIIDDDSAEKATSHVGGSGARKDDRDKFEDERRNEPPQKKQKLSKEEKKKRSGANKGRRFGKMRDEVELCWKTARSEECEFGDKCELCFSLHRVMLSDRITGAVISTLSRVTFQRSRKT